MTGRMRIQGRTVSSLTMALVAIVLACSSLVAPDIQPVAGAARSAGHSDVSPRSLLAASACPMAHCDPQMSDNEPIVIPTSTVTTTWSFTTTGSIGGTGLGCTTGVGIAVCVGINATGSLTSGLPFVYGLVPSTGRQLWNSGTLLNASVMNGAPLIDSAGNSYVSDNSSIVSFNISGTVRWQVPNPAHSALISLNVVADGYLVGQGILGPLVVIDPATGQLLGSVLLRDTVNGQPGTFVTFNTVTVLHNRVYVATSFCADSGCSYTYPIFAPGRLYAIDVVQGVPQVAWHWDFEGSTGGSPLVLGYGGSPTIYVDGAGLTSSDPHDAWLFAVNDQGTQPALTWSVDLTALYGAKYYNGIQASPAHDPRGGVWVHVMGDPRFFRLSQVNGSLLQLLDLRSLLPQATYLPSSATSIVTNQGNNPVLLSGVADAHHVAPAGMIAIDLLGSKVLWQVTTGVTMPAFMGQFPIANTVVGKMIIARRADTSTISGYLLQ